MLRFLFELCDPLLEPSDPRLRNRLALAVGGLQLREVARDARLDPLEPPLHLGLGEVPIARIHRLELRSVDGDAGHAEQSQLAPQHDEFATHLDDGLAVILAEIRDRLVIRREVSGQPDRLEIALALPLEAAARWHAVQVSRKCRF